MAAERDGCILNHELRGQKLFLYSVCFYKTTVVHILTPTLGHLCKNPNDGLAICKTLTMGHLNASYSDASSNCYVTPMMGHINASYNDA